MAKMLLTKRAFFSPFLLVEPWDAMVEYAINTLNPSRTSYLKVCYKPFNFPIKSNWPLSLLVAELLFTLPVSECSLLQAGLSQQLELLSAKRDWIPPFKSVMKKAQILKTFMPLSCHKSHAALESGVHAANKWVPFDGTHNSVIN